MEYERSRKIGIASARAGMSRKTGSKYLKCDDLPSERRHTRSWRTRKDPFEEHWQEAVSMLEVAPELEAKALFEWLQDEYPGAYHAGQLRTFQRRVREWRALEGPAREVMFPQTHKPGKRMSTDFTSTNSLQITIGGERFDHMLCHCVLTYSNWQWASICHSESFLALKKGIQNALVRLGHIPGEHWTDHSTAATHCIGRSGPERGFNRSYLSFMQHYGIKPRTIQPAAPNENGDVESLHGSLKSRINQHLLLRGHRDFDSIDDYRCFLHEILDRANSLRGDRLSEEINAMKVLNVSLLTEYAEETARVRCWSTINVKANTYSVPSRLIGEQVRVRLYEDRIEVFFKGKRQLTAPRLLGQGGHRINYRHIIDWLLRKPGAFCQYRFRQDLFPSLNFRWAYDQLCEHCSERTADLEYLRILHHAAITMESDVEQALATLRERCTVPRWNTVLEFCPDHEISVPEIEMPAVSLETYDALLNGGRSEQ
jgi:transposase